MSEERSKTPPTPEAALALVTEFLRLAADEGDAPAARLLMTAASTRVPAFDPLGLADKEYAIGEPFPVEDAIIIPVGFGDSTGLKASAPLVVILENGVPRIDVEAGVEMMMGGKIHYVSPDEVDGEGEMEVGGENRDEPS